jgi:hypothetical protein
VTYSNNLEKIETIRDDGLIEGADPTIAALTGRIDVRFADTTLIDLAAGGTPVDLEFAYTLSAMAKLVPSAHEVYLPKPKLAVEGLDDSQSRSRLWSMADTGWQGEGGEPVEVRVGPLGIRRSPCSTTVGRAPPPWRVAFNRTDRVLQKPFISCVSDTITSAGLCPNTICTRVAE